MKAKADNSLKGKLKARAIAANQRKEDKKQKEAEEMVAKFMAVMEAEADKGLFEAEYRGPLYGLAVEILKTNGICLRDDGGGCASVWHVTWK